MTKFIINNNNNTSICHIIFVLNYSSPSKISYKNIINTYSQLKTRDNLSKKIPKTYYYLSRTHLLYVETLKKSSLQEP